MQEPAQWFSNIILRINNPMGKMNDYITSFLPALDSKEPNINLASSFSGNTGVNNINSRIIVLINWSRQFIGKPKLQKNRPQEPIIIGSSYSSNKLCFHGTQRIDILGFRPVNNCTTVKCKINPVLDLLLLVSFTYEASTKHISYPLSNPCLGVGIFLSHTIRWHLGSGRSIWGPLLLYLIPHSLVIRRYLARFFGKL